MEKQVILLEKEVAFYAVAKSDFSSARKIAELLLNYTKTNNLIDEQCCQDSLYYGLYCAVVVCYAKPFKKNNLSQSLDAALLKLTAEQSSLHKDLIAQRDKCVAHSDHEIRNVTIYPPGSWENRPDLYLAVKNRIFSSSKISEIYELIAYLLNQLDGLYGKKIQDFYIAKGYPNKPFSIN